MQFGVDCLCLVHYYISGSAGCIGILTLNITCPIGQWDSKRIICICLMFLFKLVLIQGLLLKIISSCLVIKLWLLRIIIQLRYDCMSYEFADVWCFPTVIFSIPRLSHNCCQQTYRSLQSIKLMRSQLHSHEKCCQMENTQPIMHINKAHTCT